MKVNNIVEENIDYFCTSMVHYLYKNDYYNVYGDTDEADCICEIQTYVYNHTGESFDFNCMMTYVIGRDGWFHRFNSCVHHNVWLAIQELKREYGKTFDQVEIYNKIRKKSDMSLMDEIIVRLYYRGDKLKSYVIEGGICGKTRKSKTRNSRQNQHSRFSKRVGV